METLFYQHMGTFLTLTGLVTIALLSPGPDFAIIIRNSLMYSRRTALFTALGISLGTLLHVSYILLGLGFIIKENVWLFIGLKYLGAAYLLYIGFKGLRAQKTSLTIEKVQNQPSLSPLQAIRNGFLTNALNPKAILFFMSLFSVVLPPDLPTMHMFMYGTLIFVETLAWFSLVGYCLSTQKAREKFSSVGHWVDRVTGGLLTILGAKLLVV